MAYGIDEHGVAGAQRHSVGELVTQLDIEFSHAGRFLGQSARINHPVKWNQRRESHQHFLLMTFYVDRVHQTI